MKPMMHRGYAARIEYSEEDGVFVGRLLGIRDIVSFQGDTEEKARAAFRDSVDDYLEFCAERGKAPDDPATGTLTAYRGYIARAKYSGAEDGCLVGHVIGISDGISFDGPTEEAARKAFHDCVDGYLQTCQEIGKAPLRPEPAMRPTYRGYTALIQRSEADDCLVGHVVGIGHDFCVEGQTEEEIRAAFHDCVDGYLEVCEKLGKAPQRPAQEDG